MVPAAASRTQPFIWLALSLTFINLFDFYQLYLLVAGDPSKRYQTLLTISQFRRRAKKSYKGNLVAANPPGRYNIYLQYIGRFFSSNIIPCTHFHRHAIVPSTYHDKSMRKSNSHTFRFPQFCALSPLFEETTDISFQDESGSENDPLFGLLWTKLMALSHWLVGLCNS